MIKEFFAGYKKGRQLAKTMKAKNYYTHIDELPVYNFFKIKQGKYEYLYKSKDDYENEYPKELFQLVFGEMYFQFKRLDNKFLRDKADLQIYWSKWIIEKNYRWKNEYTTLKDELEKKVTKELDLDDFTDYIEHTFKNPVGSLDVHRVSTSKAFNNYHKAIEFNKNRNASN